MRSLQGKVPKRALGKVFACAGGKRDVTSGATRLVKPL